MPNHRLSIARDYRGTRCTHVHCRMRLKVGPAPGNDAIRVTLEEFRASRTPHHAAVVRLWPL